MLCVKAYSDQWCKLSNTQTHTPLIHMVLQASAAQEDAWLFSTSWVWQQIQAGKYPGFHAFMGHSSNFVDMTSQADSMASQLEI